MSWAPNYKVFWVTTRHRVARKREVTRRAGFVFVTPWQNPTARVVEKYPGLVNFAIEQRPKHGS